MFLPCLVPPLLTEPEAETNRSFCLMETEPTKKTDTNKYARDETQTVEEPDDHVEEDIQGSQKTSGQDESVCRFTFR